MPIDSFLNTSLLRAWAAGAFDEAELAALDKVGALIQDALMIEPYDPEGEARSEAVLRRLAVVANEVRSLGSWLAAHSFPLVEALGSDTEDDQLRAYLEDSAHRFAEHLLELAGRFQEGLHPTREEVRAWREGLPEDVPYWDRQPPLAFPPAVLPPARPLTGDPEEDDATFILGAVSHDLGHLAEMLRQAAGHTARMVADIPTPDTRTRALALDAPEAGRRHVPLVHLAEDLRSLEETLSAAAEESARIAEHWGDPEQNRDRSGTESAEDPADADRPSGGKLDGTSGSTPN